MRVTLVTCGLERVGTEALSVGGRQAGDEPTPLYGAPPCGWGSGTNARRLVHWLDSTPDAFNDTAGG